MFSTCYINGQIETNQFASVYQIEINKNIGQTCYNNWLLKDSSIWEDGCFFFDRIGTFHLKLRNTEDYYHEVSSVYTKGKSVLEQIESKILNTLRLPEYWVEEGVAEPNMACKLKASEICKHIFEVYEKIPDRIAPSKEGGVFVAFDSPDGDKTLFIEVYNDLEAVYLLNDNKNRKIVTSAEITDIEFGGFFQIINE
jgi:hypothetical protein